jgi:serine/threonine protein kinase
MKRFKAVDFSLNSKIKKQIQQEVNILKQIEHENLVKFFDLLVIDLEEHSEQRFYIFTEYYEVSNLSQFSK